MLYYHRPTIQFPSVANTFSCLNIHCVFSTKERVQVLNPDIRERLWQYMGGIAKQNGVIPKCIGGVSDHVRIPRDSLKVQTANVSVPSSHLCDL